VDLELMGIKYEVAEAITLVDLGVDGDGSLVTKLAAELEVVEGNGVMRGFDPDGQLVSLGSFKVLLGASKFVATREVLPRWEDVSV
jgi:hypothetical protein